MEAKFKDLRFNSEAEFNEWLKEVTHTIIDLEDNGQDMQRIWLHESGEILNCDFHQSFYIGKFVDMQALKIGNPLKVLNKETSQYEVYRRLIIEAIN